MLLTIIFKKKIYNLERKFIMNILPLVKSNINFNNSHISFSSQSVVQNDLYSIDNKLFIKNKVNEIINERRKNTVALISDYAVSDLKNNLLNKLNNTKKLDDFFIGRDS